MARIVATTKRTSPYDAMTIKALQQRQNELATATEAAARPREIASPWQGAAQVADSLFGGIRESQAAEAMGAKRDQLAQLQAGINPQTGATQEQVSQIGAIDPEQGRWYAERAGTLSDNLQKHGWDVQSAEAEAARLLERQKTQDDFLRSQQENQQKAAADLAAENDRRAAEQKGLDRTQTLGLQEDTQTEARTTASTLADTQAEAARVAAKSDADAAAALSATKAAEPDSGVGKITSDYNKGIYGPAGTPDAMRLRDQAIQKETAITGKNTRLYDTQGNLIYEEGTGAGGGVAGGTQDVKNQANMLDQYRQEAKANSDLTQTVDMMEAAVKGAGYTGPGGKYVGRAADIIESLKATVPGMSIIPSLPGGSGERALLDAGGLAFIQKQIAMSKGAISDFENKLFAAASPGLERTPEGNAILLGFTRGVIQRSQEKVAKAEAWTQQHGSLEGFEAAWGDYVNKNPLLGLGRDTHQLVLNGQTLKPPGAADAAPAPANPAVPAKPADIPQAEWDVMTPDEKAAFK